MKQLIVYFLFILSILGIFDAGYLAYEHFQNVIPPCTVGSYSDCGKVLNSSYATVSGVPLAVIGVVQYAIVLLLIFAVLATKKRSFMYLLLIQTKIGFLGSLYFVYLQLFVLHAICLYCMFSAAISSVLFITSLTVFSSERKRLMILIFHTAYTNVVKKIFFLFSAEKVHNLLVHFGEKLGSSGFSQTVVKFLFFEKHDSLRQTIHSIEFQTPIGLAAGFDYEARLTEVLPAWGFGFQTVGTITNHSYEGNPSPMLGRLPKSKSLMVNKGYKNLGAKETIRKLKGKRFVNAIGISIGRTNSRELTTQKESVKDIISTFKAFEASKLKHSYYELNISCPNLYGDITFYPPKNLEELLTAVEAIKVKRPIFVKMPIEKSDSEVLSMLKVISKHKIAGVIFGNLQKDRKNKAFVKSEVNKFTIGNFSGKPTFDRSNELISLAYSKYKNKLTIIGCGGVFSGRDAYEKIIRGASVVQLITGMIFEGPQLISQINFELDDLLRKNGFTHIREAIGTKKYTVRKKRA